MSDLIRTERRGVVFEISFNRPDKRNAINWEMWQGLDAAISEAEKTSGLRAIILRGEGSGFCAGIDVTSFLGMNERFGDNWRGNLFPLTAAYQAVCNHVERCSLPVIVLLHGYCLGLGFELALACDMRIAAEGTKLGLPETRLGIIPDVGGTTRLARLVGVARAKELVMTGRTFETDYAERWGMVNAVVPADQLAVQGAALVEELAQAAPLAVSHAKRVLNDLADVERGLQLEGWAQNQLIASEDFMIGIQAMLSKQPPEWKGK